MPTRFKFVALQITDFKMVKLLYQPFKCFGIFDCFTWQCFIFGFGLNVSFVVLFRGLHTSPQAKRIALVYELKALIFFIAIKVREQLAISICEKYAFTFGLKFILSVLNRNNWLAVIHA